MKTLALPSLAVSALGFSWLTLSCASGTVPSQTVAIEQPAQKVPVNASESRLPSDAPVVETEASPPRSMVPLAVPAPPPPPPPVVSAPMAGNPGAQALSEARLVTASCSDMQAVAEMLANERIEKMRAKVDAQYRHWADGQRYCWEEYRRQEQWWRMRSQGYVMGQMWGDTIGESFGVGGLGLSGIGEGGGGRGEAIRFGLVGSMGAGQPRKATSASGTNDQVAGVHEADIVKNDGRYVYFAMNGALRIVEAMDPRVLSITHLPGITREMLLEGDRAVVYVSEGHPAPRCTYGYSCQFAGDGSSTQILLLDIADRSHPKVLRTIELSGSLMAARRIGNTVHTVVADGDSAVPLYETRPEGVPSCGMLEKAVRAKFDQLKAENARKIRASMSLPSIKENGKEKALCNNLLRTKIGDGTAFTTIVSFDMTDDATAAAAATIQSRPGAVYASRDAIYLSVVHRRQKLQRGWYSFYSQVDELSDVHKFRIGDGPTATAYVGSGVVPGHVLNQFSMDEYYGYLRIATTNGFVPNPGVESAVSILAESAKGNLVRVGAIDKIAPGEDIRSVRFDGDRGYVVTFKKTDPLFVLDLYHPAHPAILGELKIPGFSTYMHRIDPNHLLSIGFDADDHGNFAYFDGVILHLFDVAEPTDPKLMHKEKIGTRGSSSEALTNHLAFNYFPEKGLLAFPMTICKGGGDGRQGTRLSFSGLLVYDVNLKSGFKRLGGVAHGTEGANCGTWWSNANSQVRRSVFLDDLVYSIAADRLKVQRMGKFGTDLANISLVD